MQGTTGTPNGVVISLAITVNITAPAAAVGSAGTIQQVIGHANVTLTTTPEMVGSTFSVLVWGELVPDQDPNYTPIEPVQNPNFEVVSKLQDPSWKDIAA